MLIQLDIENVAVIERASIEFDKGLNVITGETGAGKSLLINSLNMVLGARSSRELIREGAPFAKVSAVFFNKELDSYLEDLGIDSDEGNIILSRKLYPDGRNLCHINSSPVSVSTLKDVGDKLVVIHGQHDSGFLMNPSSHINFLDAFANNKDLLTQYKSVYKEFKETQAQLDKLTSDTVSRQNEIDFLKYQTEEIEKASLSLDEEETLINRKAILENSEAISNHSQKSYALLGNDGGAKELLYSAKRELEKLCEIDASVLSFSQKANDLYYEIDELSRDISSYISGIEYSPLELREIEDRLDTINTLKRKYNGEIPQILEFYETATERLSFLLSFDENKKDLMDRRDDLYNKAHSLAQMLSQSRHKAAQMLTKRLTDELESLDMPKCRIEFLFTKEELGTNGCEHVEFVIATNPSDSLKSLSKIASGGEISRVMLAIKSVFSDFDKIPTLLFDEIDTGVSGRAAEKIGIKMKNLSRNYQLIIVTHLPVIAAFANHHLLIEKVFEENGFKTKVRHLNSDERIKEIARIISGDNVNDISLKNAAQMIGLCVETEE